MRLWWLCWWLCWFCNKWGYGNCGDGFVGFSIKWGCGDGGVGFDIKWGCGDGGDGGVGFA